ncbi:MAG TPA: glycosyltransferase family 4 protein [Pyrinomonadaceae bacterium]
MRILLIPSSYPPVLGGLQVVVHTLARHLLRQHHQVRVITNRYPRSLPAREVIEDVTVERRLFLRPRKRDLTNWRPDLFLSSLYFYPATLMYLLRAMRELRPDVVNVHFPDAQMPFVLALRHLFKFRLVVSLHGHDIERWSAFGEAENKKMRANTGARLLRTFLNEADAVTACSSNLLSKAQRLEPGIARKGHVVHNGLDLELFNSTARYSYPRPYILSYGRLTSKKGFDLLISAFAQVAAVQPEVDLILAGDGEDEILLKRLVHEAKLDDRVHFFGRAQPGQIVELLNGCLFLVVPSRNEPFGIVALEGMAAGKPVLATRVGGLPEFLEESINQLVEPSVDGLTSGLKDWLARREELSALGMGNRRLAAKFTWARTVEQYLRVYDGPEAEVLEPRLRPDSVSLTN